MLFLSQLQLGIPIDPDNLDQAWLVALGHAYAQAMQFGRDVLFTYGPLGFVHPYQGYHPDTFAHYVAYQIVICLGQSVVIVVACRSLSIGRFYALISAVFLISSLVKTDASAFLALAAGASLLAESMRAQDQRRATVTLWAVAWLFALTGLVKTGYLLFAAIAVGGFALAALRVNQAARAVHLLLAFGTGFAALWLLAGQQLSNVAAFLATSWHVAAEYDAAMSLAGRARDVAAGVLVTVSLAVLAAFGWNRRGPIAIMRVLTSGLIIFLVWKASFVRQDDGHLLVGFAFFGWVALAAPALFEQRMKANACRKASLVVAAAALGWWAWLYAGLLTGPADALRALMADHRQTASLIAGSFVQEQERRLAAARAAGALPSIRAEIGAGSVDAFGGTQSLAVLNGLRYSPRPTLQEHMAYSDSLARANAAYLGAVAGPQYVLHRLRAIDGRFPPAEDPLSFLTLLNEFEPVGEERDVLLLRRKVARAAIETEPSAVRVTARWNEDIPVPDGAHRIIQVAFVFREDLPARFARILWRAAEIQLVVTDETGLQRRYRLPPGNARTAFLISPVIGSDQDLKAWYRSGAGRSAASLRLEIMSRRPGFLLPNLESAEFRLIPVERAFGGSP